MDTAVNKMNRRQFIGSTGLSIGVALQFGSHASEAHSATVTTQTVNSWLNIGSDNSVSLSIGVTEMGQGTFSTLGQVMAEDLMVDYSRIQLRQGGPVYNVSPAPIGSAIVTAGSSSTRNNYWKLRDAAAIARETLVQAAMNAQGDATRANYTVSHGVITHSSGKQFSYGDVAAAAALLTPPASAALVPDNQLKVIGQSLPRQDIPSKVDGSAQYGIDVRLPKMVYAVIRHCPTFGGTLVSLPATPSGALAVVPVRVSAGTGRGLDVAGNVNAVAVVGPTTWDAMQSARSLNLKWTLPANAAAMNTTQFFADAKALAQTAPAYVAGGSNLPGTLYTVESAGDADAALNQATPGSQLLDVSYQLPYVPHGCMEVLNCTVDYVAGVSCTVYAPTQVANSALALVVQLTGLTADKISFHTTLLGGGLGRKAEIDFIGQAVQVAMVVQRPVMLVWPREEDFSHDQYRPMGLVRARARVDATGQIVGWAYRNVSPSISAQRGRTLPATGDSQGYEGSNALPYVMGARRVEWVSHTAPIPVGYWRSVGASINTFAVESMIDELAWACKLDPYQFRRNRITDARWLAVLDAAATLGSWSAPTAAGTARGIAIGTAFNSIVAMVIEVSGSSMASFSIRRVSVVIDCYLPVNPGNIEAQITGGVVHGLNATLYGQQTFVNGAAQRRNFNTNPVIRPQQMPRVDVQIIPRPASTDRSKAMGGVGELGVPTLAPALANALYALTRQRVRSLPLFPTATMGD